MKIIDYIEDEFPAYALSYAVNGDETGIEDEDRENCDAWLAYCTAKLARDYPALETGLLFNDDVEPSFTGRPAFGNACDTIPCAVVVWAENEHPLQALALPWEDGDNNEE